MQPAPIPRRTRGEGRSCVVPVRLSPQDRDALAVFAERHGSTISTVLGTLGHQLAIGGGDRVAVMAEPPEVAQAFRQLARIGNNINQIARVAHRYGFGGVEQQERLGNELDSLGQLLVQIQAAVEPWAR